MNLFFKNKKIKKLTFMKKSFGGRNLHGHITIRGRFKGVKKKYKFINFFRNVSNIIGKVRRLEYDPNRNTYICLIYYLNSMLSYQLAWEHIKIGDTLGKKKNNNFFLNGNYFFLKDLNSGTFVYNLEFFPFFGQKISRSAGTFCQVLKRINEDYVLIKLKSKEQRLFFKNNIANLGSVYNHEKKFVKLNKAGDSYYLGIKPLSRGEAKNPIDHPHGGNTSGGRHPVTPWGKLTRGIKTSSRKGLKFIYKFRFKK